AGRSKSSCTNQERPRCSSRPLSIPETDQGRVGRTSSRGGECTRCSSGALASGQRGNSGLAVASRTAASPASAWRRRILNWVNFRAVKQAVSMEMALAYYGVMLRRVDGSYVRGRCPVLPENGIRLLGGHSKPAIEGHFKTGQR